MRVHLANTEKQHADASLLARLDVAHLPSGCATWPAWWTRPLSSSFEEIDIWENTNDLYGVAGISDIHTRSNCILRNPTQTGTLETEQCFAKANGNEGCRVNLKSTSGSASKSRSLAMERSFEQGGQGIRVWSWLLGQGPVSEADLSVRPDDWGVPAAHFPIQECDNSAFAEPHMLVSYREDVIARESFNKTASIRTDPRHESLRLLDQQYCT